MICAAMNATGAPSQIVFAGERSSAPFQALTRAAHARFLPNYVLLRGKETVNGQPAAYVCRNFTCQLPVTTVDALNDLLK
jgi:uncharacterized protein YyaL (SSP411 family)